MPVPSGKLNNSRSQPSTVSSVEDGDGWTRQVISRVQSDGTCWLSGTVWRGRTLMRISVCIWSTAREDVERSAAAILAAHRA